MLEKIEDTIKSTCEWIQKQTDSDSPSEMTPQMILALAELINARANNNTIVQY